MGGGDGGFIVRLDRLVIVVLHDIAHAEDSHVHLPGPDAHDSREHDAADSGQDVRVADVRGGNWGVVGRREEAGDGDGWFAVGGFAGLGGAGFWGGLDGGSTWEGGYDLGVLDVGAGSGCM